MARSGYPPGFPPDNIDIISPIGPRSAAPIDRLALPEMPSAQAFPAGQPYGAGVPLVRGLDRSTIHGEVKAESRAAGRANGGTKWLGEPSGVSRVVMPSPGRRSAERIGVPFEP